MACGRPADRRLRSRLRFRRRRRAAAHRGRRQPSRPADGELPEALIRNATTALSELKANPLQRYQFYRAEMTKAAIHRWTIEADLRRAIERKEFLLHYQPQIDVRLIASSGPRR